MTLAQSDSEETKRRIFYKWLIDRMERIGYDEIPDYYMEAWKTLDPMQLPFGFIHEWHHFWRDWQSSNQEVASSARQPKSEVEDSERNAQLGIAALLSWLRIDALKKFKEVISCVIDDNQELLNQIHRSVDAVNPVPCCQIPNCDEIKRSINLITRGNATKRKRLRTILRLLHHPDHGGNAEMFITIEDSFKV